MTKTVCPIHRKEKDAAKHELDCEIELEKGKHTVGSSNINYQTPILKIFRENQNKRTNTYVDSTRKKVTVKRNEKQRKDK